MAEAPKDTDQSMEDILQSIKRIIADEGEPAPTVAGSDVLELTELLAEDVAVPDTVAATEAEDATPQVESVSFEELMAEPAPAAPVAAPAPPPAPAVVAAPASVVKAAPIPEATGEKIMSDATVAASAAALSALTNRSSAAPTTHISPGFRSGTTVEDLVLESLKPMLREWLDGNLPAMVRSLVEKEIRRLSGN